MSQGSFNPKTQKVCPVAHAQTDRQTHMKVKIEDTLSGFQEFSLQPIIKDRSNITSTMPSCIVKMMYGCTKAFKYD